ncbi:non-heme iron oxygenase ferredoxin subunit [SAR202 cluster bacterium AD-802-E10_MRT_200m]|nr:non-heme iron oxygenase ferredoxin subunit [SAR202 cluster bacterium AD-802-E10_MRT_200m]
MPKQFKKIADISDIHDEEIKIIFADGQSFAVAKVRGKIFVVENLCTHDGGPLEKGRLFGYVIECPRHGAQFDLRTGLPVCVPAKIPIKCYQVRIHGTAVEIEL